MELSKNSSKEGSYISRHHFLDMILQKLDENNQTLEKAIAQRDLYLRVSVIGICNLNCPFCHNEGAPKASVLDLNAAVKLMEKAYKVGYKRIHFTGGEPLLHSNIRSFIREARKIFMDVGITTNGTYLPKKISSLIEEGISRIHISLQMQMLVGNSKNAELSVPLWFRNIVKLIKQEKISIRTNLLFPQSKISRFKSVVNEILNQKCDVLMLPILKDKKFHSESDYLNELKRFASAHNRSGIQRGKTGQLLVRTCVVPEGIRCSDCESLKICREGSRSLRIGADGILRPCLASRKWDFLFSEKDLSKRIKEASLFAIDYKW